MAQPSFHDLLLRVTPSAMTVDNVKLRCHNTQHFSTTYVLDAVGGLKRLTINSGVLGQQPTCRYALATVETQAAFLLTTGGASSGIPANHTAFRPSVVNPPSTTPSLTPPIDNSASVTLGPTVALVFALVLVVRLIFD